MNKIVVAIVLVVIGSVVCPVASGQHCGLNGQVIWGQPVCTPPLVVSPGCRQRKAATELESYAYGEAEKVRARAESYVLVSEAMNRRAQAQRILVQNRQAFFDNAAQEPENGEDARVDYATGAVIWPRELRLSAYGSQRGIVEYVLTRQAICGGAGKRDFGRAVRATRGMLAQLQRRSHQIPADDYRAAEGFLRQLLTTACQ